MNIYRCLGLVAAFVLLAMCVWLLFGRIAYEPPSITPRRALGAAPLNGYLYAIGGWNGVATQLDLVEIYDPVRQKWVKGPPLTVARSQHGVVVADGGLWVIGGWNANVGLVSAVERLALGDPGWTIATHLPVPRREPGVTLWLDQIVVAGGFTGSSDADIDGYSNRVDRYDWRTNQWQRLANLAIPRRGLALVAVADRLFAIGGYSAEEGFTNVVEEYDWAHDRWFVQPWPLTPRTWAAGGTVTDQHGTVLVLAGGYNLDGFLTLVERIDPVTGAICLAAPLAEARSWFAAVPTAAGLWALGGETATGFTGTVEPIATDCE